MNGELKHTVQISPNIFEVHFDTQGLHYFNTWPYQEQRFGRFIDGSPMLSSRIVETKTREEILGIRKSFDTTDKKDFVDETLKNKHENRKNKR